MPLTYRNNFNNYCSTQYSKIHFASRLWLATSSLTDKGSVLWPCYSDIIYVTSPDNCWLYLFYRSAFLSFCLPVISSSVYANAVNVPSLVIVTGLSVSDEEKRVTALTSHQSSLWKIDIVLPSKQQLQNRPVPRHIPEQSASIKGWSHTFIPAPANQ